MDQIVLFDGICNLCNGAVKFIMKNDKSKLFTYAPLQSERGKRLMREHGLPENRFDTIIYMRGKEHYELSSAVLEILKDLGGGWKIFYAFILVPPFIRNFIYRIIAGIRYRVFGKTDHCVVP